MINCKKLLKPKLVSALACLTIVGGLSAQTSFSGLDNSYHIGTLAMAGSGSILSSPENDRLNPAAGYSDERRADFSWLRYPAGISSGYASFRKMVRSHSVAISLRHLNYGSFDGYDESAVSTGNYSSGDSWISVAIARERHGGRLAYGLTTGMFFSQLADYRASLLLFTPGVIWNLEKMGVNAGLSLNNWGVILDSYTDANEKLPARLTAGFSRKLKYLPLELFVDYGYLLEDGTSTIGLGGVFTLSMGFELRWGTSTDKINQAPGNQDERDLLAASGLALSYSHKDISIDVGTYFYGPGAWSSGIGLGVAF